MGGRSQSQGTMRTPTKRLPSTQRRISRAASAGFLMSALARPRSRCGAAPICAATSSLVMSGPCGPYQAESSEMSTPPASIAASVCSTLGTRGLSSCPVQRKSVASQGWAAMRSVVTCAQTSIAPMFRSLELLH
ncbi:MAG: hypothetical protein RH982_17470 [Parvibaculum sp.]